MMITIHGLPPMTTFQTVQALLRQECNTIDLIVDNLVDDGPNSKKVRIGLSDDAEGYRVIKCLNGFRMSSSHVLKIVPVGKVLNPPPHQNYNQRSGFPSQPRNEYPNQPRPEYQQNHSINDYESREPQGPHGSMDFRPAIVRPNTNMQRQRGPPEPIQPVSHRPEHTDARSLAGPDPMHLHQWDIEPNPNKNSSNNQWAPLGPDIHTTSEDTYNQRLAQPSFGQQIPIMKDNFQGPSQHLGPALPVWREPGQQPKSQAYDDRRHPPLDRRSDMSKQMPQDYEKRAHFSPPRNARPLSPPRDMPSNVGRNYQERGRRVSPQGRSFPIGDRRISPTGRLGPPVRDFSPSGRRVTPPGRIISPSDRRISPPGMMILPSGRRISPTVRRDSPPGIRNSHSVRRSSPPDRKSPGRRFSPGRREEARRISPNERGMSRLERETPRLVSPPPRPIRFSPTRLGAGGKPADKFTDGKWLKPVRPAYESSQVQNQTYPGGYSANVHENVQYPASRQEPQILPWQVDQVMYPSNVKNDEERRDAARRHEKPAAKSPERRSRSPMRRSRSPPKERYRRHSPSPRSPRSPRHSWALEKSSSPAPREPPPPPVWPGQEPDGEQPPHLVWDRERKPAQDKLRLRTDLHEDKFASRREDVARENSVRDDFRRDEPRRDEKIFSDIDKDFEDIYQRAVELRKKTEERKSGERRREEERYRRDESPPRSRERERNDSRKPASGDRNHIVLLPAVKDKRDKAVDHLAERLLQKYDIKGEHRVRVTEELKHTMFNLFLDMFAGKDMSYIELVVKFQTKYRGKDEDKLMQEVVSRLPSQYRGLKRRADGDTSVIAAKFSRRSPSRNAREDIPHPKLSETVIPEWATGLPPPNMMSMSLAGVNPPLVNMAPGVLPQPVYIQTHLEMLQQAYHHGQPPQFSVNAMQQQPQFSASLMQQQPQFSANAMQLQPQFSADAMQHQPQNRSNLAETPQDPLNEYYNLYLCQDDFEPFSELQAEHLKNFLVSQIVHATETSNGWAPDLTLKGLQNLCRYEVSTKDETSKDWVLNLNFAEFELFNVLVYTKEELWYERAAIWLPGHSRSRNIEPFEKLKMQNKRLEGVNLGKWKFVKKVVTIKGTRLYVDMPPSAARGLEKHKMMLSYELQKVNVFLKAVAVDKDVFDNGLKEASITDPSLLISAAATSPMPTINANTEPSVVKIGLNGKKSLTVEQARKIKEVVVFFLFKYLKEDGTSRTDFVKFGFCQPCFLGIIPDNIESKRWLMSRNFGKMSRNNITVFGGNDDNTKYFKMIVYIPYYTHTNAQMACERLKQSNQGVKGIHFNLWKPIRIVTERTKAVLEVDMDLESVEAISRINYKMDFVGDNGIKSVQIKSEYSLSTLEEKIRKCRQEQVDTYDVANMELESDSDTEIIY